MRRKKFVILFAILLLSGCGHMVEIQYQAYAVGIGVDYKEEKFHVYLQFMDFSNLAKTEGSSINIEKPVWIGAGKGNTIDEALIDIYKGMQIKVNYDQMQIFLFSKNAIDHKLNDIIESLDTNFNFRLSGYVYGTEENLQEILTSKMPFYYPYITSHLAQPLDTHSLASDLPPLETEEMIIRSTEKTKMLIIPKVVMNKNIIHKDTHILPVPVIKGAYFNRGYDYLGSINKEDLTGYIKFNSNSERSLIHLYYDESDSTPISIEVRDPKDKKSVKKEDGQERYQLTIKVSVILREGAENRDPLKVEKRFIEEVKKDVMASINKAKNIGADIYQFEDYLYRHEHKLWEENKHDSMLEAFTIDDITVDITYVKSISKIYGK